MKLILISILLLLTVLSDDSSIKQIRYEFDLINNSLDSYTKVQNNDVGLLKDTNPATFPFESEEIFRLAIVNMTRFYDQNGIRKAIVTFFGDRQDLISEYYYKNDSLFFVFKTKIDYKSPKWSDNFNKNEKDLIENRYYFSANKLIKWINKDHELVKLNSIHLETEKQIISDSKQYVQVGK
ncbi:MAG: hypothetical protein HQ522_01150 [Bacteroidetes bacterium]|nr:hypothetical protein [Bacteroidota bacterium]